MRRVVLILAAAVTAAATAACGGGDIAVLAQLDGAATGTQETEAVALSSLPIRLLPFDRDVVFDSLAEAYPEPEPEVPDSIFELQQRVQDRYLTYQQANTRWATLRDSLQTLSDRMQRMDQGSGEYFALYQEFNDMEGEVNTLETRANDAFEEFTTLQSRLNAQSQEITLARRAWADARPGGALGHHGRAGHGPVPGRPLRRLVGERPLRPPVRRAVLERAHRGGR
jgi:hypothetical protein